MRQGFSSFALWQVARGTEADFVHMDPYGEMPPLSRTARCEKAVLCACGQPHQKGAFMNFETFCASLTEELQKLAGEGAEITVRKIAGEAERFPEIVWTGRL